MGQTERRAAAWWALMTLLAASALMALATLSGCDVLGTAEGRVQLADELAQRRAEAEQIREAALPLETILAELDEAIAALPAESREAAELAAQRARVAEVARRADEVLDAAAADVAALEAILREADSEADVIAGAVGLGAQHLPPPWNVYAGLVAGLLGVAGGVLEAVRRRRAQRELAQTSAAAADVIRAIEAAKTKHGGRVDFADEQVRSELRSRMSDEARLLVDAVRAAE